MICPDCDSSDIVKNGRKTSGKQNFMCKSCNRQFVENPENKIISQATRELVEDLLLDRFEGGGRLTRFFDIAHYLLLALYYLAGEDHIAIDDGNHLLGFQFAG